MDLDIGRRTLYVCLLTILSLAQCSAKVEPATPQNKECPPGCTDHGNCNGESGECECQFGFGGPDCSQRLLPACHLAPEVKGSIPAFGHWMPKNCLCHAQLRKYGCPRPHFEDPYNCPFYQFWAWNEIPCFLIKDVPDDQQYTLSPDGPTDPRVVWKKGHYNHTSARSGIDPYQLVDAPPPSPYTLPDQSTWLPLDKCGDSKCSGRGWCALAPRIDGHPPPQPQCRCLGFYGGDACETPQAEHCFQGCSGRGTCHGGFCHCKPSYWGLACARSQAYVSDTWLPHPSKLRVYVYSIPEQLAFKKPWHDIPALVDTMYLAEVSFVDSLLGDGAVLTQNPWEANLFLINAYTFYFTGNIGYPARHFSSVFNYVRTKYPFWNLTAGRNHIALATNDRGTCDLYKLQRTQPELSHPIKLVHYGQAGRLSIHSHRTFTIKGQPHEYDPAFDAAVREWRRLALRTQRLHGGSSSAGPVDEEVATEADGGPGGGAGGGGGVGGGSECCATATLSVAPLAPAPAPARLTDQHIRAADDPHPLSDPHPHPHPHTQRLLQAAGTATRPQPEAQPGHAQQQQEQAQQEQQGPEKEAPQRGLGLGAGWGSERGSRAAAVAAGAAQGVLAAGRSAGGAEEQAEEHDGSDTGTGTDVEGAGGGGGGEADAHEYDRIPRLWEVFQAWPHVPVQVDLKSSDPALVAAVAELVAAQPGRERLLLWGSFHQRTAAACLAAAPGLPLFASMQRALVMMAAYQLGLLRYLHIYEAAVVVPWRLHLSPTLTLTLSLGLGLGPLPAWAHRLRAAVNGWLCGGSGGGGGLWRRRSAATATAAAAPSSSAAATAAATATAGGAGGTGAGVLRAEEPDVEVGTCRRRSGSNGGGSGSSSGAGGSGSRSSGSSSGGGSGGGGSSSSCMGGVGGCRQPGRAMAVCADLPLGGGGGNPRLHSHPQQWRWQDRAECSSDCLGPGLDTPPQQPAAPSQAHPHHPHHPRHHHHPCRLQLRLTYYFLDAGWFAALNARGVAVVVFGALNDTRRMEACRRSGANAIATDTPSHLAAFLAGGSSSSSSHSCCSSGSSSSSNGSSSGSAAVDCDGPSAPHLLRVRRRGAISGGGGSRGSSDGGGGGSECASGDTGADGASGRSSSGGGSRSSFTDVGLGSSSGSASCCSEGGASGPVGPCSSGAAASGVSGACGGGGGGVVVLAGARPLAPLPWLLQPQPQPQPTHAPPPPPPPTPPLAGAARS